MKIKPWRQRLEELAHRTLSGHIQTSIEEIEELMQAEIDELRVENDRLHQICTNVHDSLLRGTDDGILLVMLDEANT